MKIDQVVALRYRHRLERSRCRRSSGWCWNLSGLTWQAVQLSTFEAGTGADEARRHRTDKAPSSIPVIIHRHGLTPRSALVIRQQRGFRRLFSAGKHFRRMSGPFDGLRLGHGFSLTTAASARVLNHIAVKAADGAVKEKYEVPKKAEAQDWQLS